MPEMPPNGPALSWRTRLFASGITTLTSVSRRRDGTVNRLLLSLFSLKSSPNANPVNGVKSADYTLDPSRDLWIRLFSSGADAGDSPSPAVIVYFHGGGFVFHSAASGPYDALCRRIAGGIPAAVVSVDYRLSPEHRFPAAYDDGFDVLQWIDGREDLFPDVSKVFLAGDSAGGNIAHHVAVRSAAASFERVRITGAVLLQPFFGGEERTDSEVRLDGMPMGSLDRSDWMWKMFLPAGSDRDHEAANPFGSESRPDLSGFPPTMVCVGGFDPLRDRQIRYYEWLKGAGVEVCLAEYQNAIHGFYVFAELPDAGKVITDMKEFVMRRLKQA